jgi:hypothetical protein
MTRDAELVGRAVVGFERFGKTTRRAAFLAEMEQVVPWSALCALIQPFYLKPGKRSISFPASTASSANPMQQSTPLHRAGLRRLSLGFAGEQIEVYH